MKRLMIAALNFVFLVGLSASNAAAIHLNAIRISVSPLANAGIVTARAGGVCALTPQSTLQSKRVLDYLRDMADMSRRLHRHDLATLYEDAWQIAAERIFGPLPARFPMKAFPPLPPDVPRRDTAAGMGKGSPTPAWRLEILSRPWRKIVARDGDYEVLECGHRCYHTEVPGSPAARRRRCRDCAREAANKKPVESAAKGRSKGATA